LAGISFVDFLPTGDLPIFLLEILPFFKKLLPVALKKWAGQSTYW
jgi:hypothetical protein